MTTSEFLAYIDANGLERALERFDDEPTDDRHLAMLFVFAQKKLSDYHDAAAEFDNAIRARQVDPAPASAAPSPPCAPAS